MIVSGGLFLVASDLWFLCLVDFIRDPAVTCTIPELVSDPSESCDLSVIAPGLVCLLLQGFGLPQSFGPVDCQGGLHVSGRSSAVSWGHWELLGP